MRLLDETARYRDPHHIPRRHLAELAEHAAIDRKVVLIVAIDEPASELPRDRSCRIHLVEPRSSVNSSHHPVSYVLGCRRHLAPRFPHPIASFAWGSDRVGLTYLLRWLRLEARGESDIGTLQVERLRYPSRALRPAQGSNSCTNPALRIRPKSLSRDQTSHPASLASAATSRSPTPNRSPRAQASSIQRSMIDHVSSSG